MTSNVFVNEFNQHYRKYAHVTMNDRKPFKKAAHVFNMFTQSPINKPQIVFKTLQFRNI